MLAGIVRTRLSAAGALGLLAVLLAAGPSSPASPSAAPEPEPLGGLPLDLVAKDLGAMGIAVSRGAAPGYADEQSCALCHGDLAASYAERGMARSFRWARPGGLGEDLAAAPFVHAASGQTMRIARRGDRLLFERWQTDEAGRPINRFETPVDWVLGSGSHARTYLY
jgi:hypothetical protein